MKSTARAGLWGVLSVFGLAAIGVWVWIGSGEVEPLAPSAQSDGEHADHAAGEMKVETPASPQTLKSSDLPSLAGQAEPERSVADSSSVLRITDASGKPLADAVVTVHALDNDVVGYFPEDRWTDWLYVLVERTQRLLATGVQGVSDEDGAVTLALPDEGPWVLWASHPSGLAAEYTQADGGPLQLPAELKLQPAAVHTAHAVDAAGRSVAGARVVQQALLPDDDGVPNDPIRLVRRALVREHITDGSGNSNLHALGGRQWIVAESGGRRSAPVLLTEDADVELVLGQSFTIESRASGVDGATLGPWAMLSVYALKEAEDAGEREQLVFAAAHAPDSVGSFSVPLVPDAARYRAQLAMGGNEFVSRSFAAPTARGRVFLDFEFRSAIRHWLSVVRDDDPEVPVAGARVSYSWTGLDGKPASRMAVTAAHGAAYLLGIPIGSDLTYAIEANGFAPYQSTVFRLGAADNEQGLQARMTASPPLRVRVLDDGEPIQAYSFSTWPTGADVVANVLRDVAMDADGWHRIPGTPRGAGKIVAADPQGPITAAASLPAPDANGELVVELNLAESRGGAGRLLDAASGQPISGGTVQPTLNTDLGASVAVPVEPALSGSDGRFEVERILGDDARAIVRAEGFAPRWITARSLDGEQFDFGDVLMTSDRSLRVQLTGEDPRGYTDYFLVPGLYLLEEQGTRFDSEGQAELPSVSTTRQFSIRHPQSAWDRITLPSESADGYVELPLATGDELEVRFIGADGESVEVVGEVMARFTEGEAHVDRWRPIVVAASAAFLPAPTARSFELLWVPSDGSFGQGRARIEWDPARPRPVELQIRRDDAPRLRVVNADGEPMEQVLVMQSPGGAGGNPLNRSQSVTDVNGDAIVMFPDETPLEVDLRGPDGALAIGFTVSARSPGEVQQVLFDTPHELELVATGDDGPLATAVPVLESIPARFGLALLECDENGVARHEHLGAGRYRLTTRAPGHFPSRVELDVPTGRVEVELRPVGSLVVEALTASAAAGAEVRITSTEGLGDLAGWIAAGDLAPIDARLDADGRLQVDGIPRGTYRVQVEGVGEAEATVVAGSEAAVTVPGA